MSNDKEDVMVPENTLATPVFQKMRAIVEDPKNGLLQHYSRDFYVHDRNSLNLLATPEAEFVWMPYDMGSHLVKIGIHRRLHDWLEACLSTYGGRWQAYHVSIKGCQVRPVSREKVNDLMRKFRFKVDGRLIRRAADGVAIASIETIECVYEEGNKKGMVQMNSHGKHLSLDELLAVQSIAEAELVGVAHSLFVQPGVMQLDGADIRALCDEARAKYIPLPVAA